MNQAANQLVLSASIAELEGLRYTPAGVPALNLRLEHASEIQEAGQARQVRAMVRAIAFGAVAETLVRQTLGSSWKFKGFLASARNAKTVVFHIQQVSDNQ